MDSDADDDRAPPNRRAIIDSHEEPLAARDTEGGDYFFQFHVALHYLPEFLGFVLVALASFVLMVSLTTGLIVHRRIFADFFTFRPRDGQRSWLDAHTLFAVLALPFHVMITYTGVAILVFFLTPWAVFAGYPAAAAAYFWANRLLPASVPERSNAEILCSFGCWMALSAWSVWRPKRRAWIESLSVGGLLFLALPVLNAETSLRGR